MCQQKKFFHQHSEVSVSTVSKCRYVCSPGWTERLSPALLYSPVLHVSGRDGHTYLADGCYDAAHALASLFGDLVRPHPQPQPRPGRINGLRCREGCYNSLGCSGPAGVCICLLYYNPEKSQPSKKTHGLESLHLNKWKRKYVDTSLKASICKPFITDINLHKPLLSVFLKNIS